MSSKYHNMVTMNLIDTHSHLEWPDFRNKLDQVIERARSSGIIAIISSSVFADAIQDVLNIADKYKNYVFCSCGFAPSEFGKRSHTFQKYIDFLKKEDNYKKFVAIGEIGLDYYWIKDIPTRKLQEEKFIETLELANKIKKPIVIHCRDAESRTIELIEHYFESNMVHMHCFSGSTELIQRGVRNGWMFSVPTSVINRKYHQNLAKSVPLEQMMLETDAPFLSPIKNERMNESKNIVLSAKYIAETKGINVERVAEQTTENAIKFFSLKI